MSSREDLVLTHVRSVWRWIAVPLFVLAAVLYGVSPIYATVYNVGQGKPYTSIGAVPWYALTGGDTVNIYYQSTPYREIVNISTRGSANNPINIIGIPGPNGEQPIIDGQDATISSNMHFAFPNGTPTRGVVVIGPQSGFVYGFKPGYINISGLTIRNASSTHTFINSSGASQSYSTSGASIFVERGEHITVSNCTITGSGNGFFVASSGDEATQSRDITLQGSYIYNNGTSGSYLQHNLYTECIGVVIQYNHFGRTLAGSTGNNLKDRSAGTVIRYNWFDEGAHLMDLVDPQDGAALEVADPSYHQTYVYGNVFYNGPPPYGATSMIHYGGDDGLTQNYRKGTLYFYNNTIVIEADQSGTFGRWRTIILKLETSEEVADVRNNIIFRKPYTAGATPTSLELLGSAGTATFSGNWVSPGWITTSSSPFSGSVTGTNNFFVDPNNNPGFVNLTGQDFRLAAGSNAIDKGGSLASAVFTNPAGQNYDITKQYVKHQGAQSRTVGGTASDYGATEASGSGCTYGVAPLAASYASGGGAGSFTVSAASGCTWTATSNASWITLSGASGTSNGTVNYSVAANTGTASRTGTVSIMGETFTVTQFAQGACSFSFSPASAAYTTSGGSGSVTVAAPGGCAWSATSSTAWLTITAGASGSGTSTLSYSVAANSGSSRSATITIAGQQFGVSQAGSGCITVASGSGFANNAFAAQTTTLTAQFDATPSAAPTDDVIALSNGPQSAYSGFACLVVFDSLGHIVARNGGSYASASTISYSAGSTYHFRLVVNITAHTYSTYVTPPGGSELTVGSNYAFRTEQNTVTQLSNYGALVDSGGGGSGSMDVCNFTLGSSCTYGISTSNASVGAAGGTGSVGVTASTGCGWTATSNASWITITAGTSGSGNGTVSYSAAANTGPDRNATITIAGQPFVINQTSGCTYSTSVASVSVAAAGATGTVSVTAGTGCAWTATSSASWITITAGSSGTGDGSVSYSVAANTGTARTGSATIAGQPLTISQLAAGPATVMSFYTDETAATVSFTGGLGSATIAPEGLGGSNCLKFTGISGWDKTKRIHFATAKDISSVLSTDKLRISIEMTPGTPATTIGVNFNGRWDVLVWTPTAIDNTTGYQTFDISISGIRTALGNTLNDIYFQAGSGFPSGATLKVDEIKFVR